MPLADKADEGRRARAIEALAWGATVTDAARAAGYSREHVSRLMSGDPSFRLALDEKRASLHAEARNYATGQARQMVEVLVGVATDAEAAPADRIRAAAKVLDIIGLKGGSSPAPSAKVAPSADAPGTVPMTEEAIGLIHRALTVATGSPAAAPAAS